VLVWHRVFLFHVESTEIKIEIEYTASDLRHRWLKAAKTTLLQTAAFIFIALFIVYVVASHYINAEIPENVRILAVFFLIGTPLVAVTMNLISIERAVRRKAKEHGTLILTVGEDGFTAIGTDRSATSRWTRYKGAVEFGDRFEIVSDQKGGLLIPKRSFATDDHLRSFRELIRQVFGERFISK
jgi:hypothetical protein